MSKLGKPLELLAYGSKALSETLRIEVDTSCILTSFYQRLHAITTYEAGTAG